MKMLTDELWVQAKTVLDSIEVSERLEKDVNVDFLQIVVDEMQKIVNAMKEEQQ